MSEVKGIKLYRKIELINGFMEFFGFTSVETVKMRDTDGIIYWVDGLKGFYNYKTKTAMSFVDAQHLVSMTVFLSREGLFSHVLVPTKLKGSMVRYALPLSVLVEALGYGMSMSSYMLLGDILSGYKGLVYAKRKHRLIDEANDIVLEVVK
jgi:hypothetical protein